MITERDTAATAKLARYHHGEVAWLYAARRADGLPDRGDMEGARVWKLILQRIGVATAH